MQVQTMPFLWEAQTLFRGQPCCAFCGNLYRGDDMSDDDMGMQQELPEGRLGFHALERHGAAIFQNEALGVCRGEGVKKEIVKAAPESNYLMPKARPRSWPGGIELGGRFPQAGDEVTVHYVGTLEPDPEL